MLMEIFVSRYISYLLAAGCFVFVLFCFFGARGVNKMMSMQYASAVSIDENVYLFLKRVPY